MDHKSCKWHAEHAVIWKIQAPLSSVVFLRPPMTGKARLWLSWIQQNVCSTCLCISQNIRLLKANFNPSKSIQANDNRIPKEGRSYKKVEKATHHVAPCPQVILTLWRRRWKLPTEVALGHQLLLVMFLKICLQDVVEEKSPVEPSTCFRNASLTGESHVPRCLKLVSVLLINFQGLLVLNCVHRKDIQEKWKKSGMGKLKCKITVHRTQLIKSLEVR